MTTMMMVMMTMTTTTSTTTTMMMMMFNAGAVVRYAVFISLLGLKAWVHLSVSTAVWRRSLEAR